MESSTSSQLAKPEAFRVSISVFLWHALCAFHAQGPKLWICVTLYSSVQRMSWKDVVWILHTNIGILIENWCVAKEWTIDYTIIIIIITINFRVYVVCHDFLSAKNSQGLLWLMEKQSSPPSDIKWCQGDCRHSSRTCCLVIPKAWHRTAKKRQGSDCWIWPILKKNSVIYNITWYGTYIYMYIII